MPSNHLIPFCPLLLLPSIVPNIKWELTQKKLLEYKTQHNPTTSSTLCRTPHISNEQKKNKNPNYQQKGLSPHSAFPIKGKTKKQKFSTISPSTKLTQATGQTLSSVQSLSCPTLCDPMNHSTPGLSVHHQFPEFTQIHIHRVSDAIQPSHPLFPPSPPAPNPSQHQSLFQWVNSSHKVSKILEFQL